MDISVVIVTKNRAELLLRSLNALRHQEFPLRSFEVIVADNDAGEDDIVERIGDVTDGDHDVGVDEAGQRGMDKEDSQTN